MCKISLANKKIVRISLWFIFATFLVEEKLIENGAITVNKENIPDKRDVIIDDRIVTTMFLPSAALVAKEMLILLEKTESPTNKNNLPK